MFEVGLCLLCWEIVECFCNQVDKMDFMVLYLLMLWVLYLEYGLFNNYFVFKGEYQFNLQYIWVVGGMIWYWVVLMWCFLLNDFKLCSVYGIVCDWLIQYQDFECYYGLVEEVLGVWGLNDEDLGLLCSQLYFMVLLLFLFNECMIKDVFNVYDVSFYVVIELVVCNSCLYDGCLICCGNNNCMLICLIGVMYNGIVYVEKVEQVGVWLIENVVVFKFEVGVNKCIVVVCYKDLKGVEYCVEGKWFVLVVNGIEMFKLMLMFISQDFLKGVGNSFDMVGCNLMDYFGIGVSFYVDCKLWLGCGLQEMILLIGFCDGLFCVMQVGKKLYLLNILCIEQEMQCIFKEGKFIKFVELDVCICDQVVCYVQFDSFYEILLLLENCIVFSVIEVDVIGILCLEIMYYIDDYVKCSVVYMCEVYVMVVQVMGGINVEFYDDFVFNNYIIGVIIMGVDLKDFVVDKDCWMFDYLNLFISSSFIMLIVGIVNVMLIIVVLVLCIVD